MLYSAGSLTLLTSKSVPVHPLISSGVSPSHISTRVRPFVLSTSNTAWPKNERKRIEMSERNKGGKEKIWDI